MSVQFNGTVQGKFTADGNSKILQIRQDIDWMIVKNETAIAQTASDLGAIFYWQRGDTSGRGFLETKLGTIANDPTTVGQIAAGAGFYLVDSSDQSPEAQLTLTQIDGSAPPVVSSADTGNVQDGDIVRILNVTGAQQLGGMDFTVGNVSADTSFELTYGPTIVTTAGGLSATYRRIPFDPIYYPRRRFIPNITSATSAVVTLTVTHAFTVGQKVRFHVPEVTASTYGMTEMDGLLATITAVATNTITVNVDSSGFTAFAFPLTVSGTAGFTPAHVVPVGENMVQALSSGVSTLGDATINQSFIGMLLIAGNASPAGNTSDVISWIAGKSWSVTNE